VVKGVGQEGAGARITIAHQPPSLLRRVAQWWWDFQIGGWPPSTLLNPIHALALCLGAILCLTGYGLYRRWRSPAESKIVKENPGAPKTEREMPTASPQPSLSPPPQTGQTRDAISSPPRPKSTSSHSTTHRMIQDDLEMVTVDKDGTVRLSDQTVLPASLSQFARELLETGLVTPTEDARLALATFDDLTRDAQSRAQG